MVTKIRRTWIATPAQGVPVLHLAEMRSASAAARPAVRAMQLDINAYWPSFITYRDPGARDPANLLPDMTRSPYRYLTPDDRDFFAVYEK